MNPAQAALAAALDLHKRGDLAGAEAAYRNLLQRFGQNPDAEHMLGVTLHAQGRSEEALPWFEKAQAQRAGPVLWSNHAAALLATGRAAEAAALCRRALGIDPRQLGAWLNLGLASEIERDLGEAVAALETALRISPEHRVALRALARCRLALGDAAAASGLLKRVAAGTDPAADLMRCKAWVKLGDLDAAAPLLQRLAEQQDTRAEAMTLQAEVAAQRGHSDQALELFDQAAALDANNREAQIRPALMRINRGETEAGLTQLRQWLEQHPGDTAAASNYLVACDYSERYGPLELLAEHRRLAPAPAPVADWPQGWKPPAGKLRIGWVSSAFSVGPMEIFFADVLRAFAEVAPDVENLLYAVGGESTSAPASASWAPQARDASRIGNRQLVEMIRADELDILVDLIGRAAGSRLPVFAARAAPVQVGWLDAFYPSGVAAMDYLITDRWLSPAGADADFSEKLLRLPHGRLAYSPPPAQAPDPEGAASRRFVSLNRFSKVGENVIGVWAAILRELPDWTLLLKAHGYDGDLGARFKARFAAHGVAPERVQIEDGGSYAHAMQAYQTAAIALDPFPFSGCSTTCDALWMGLPVVTWPRETIASRQSAAWLELAGKRDWVVHDAEAYVAKAVELARDDSGRRQWRTAARGQLRAAMCDSRRLARELMDALRAVAPARGASSSANR